MGLLRRKLNGQHSEMFNKKVFFFWTSNSSFKCLVELLKIFWQIMQERLCFVAIMQAYFEMLTGTVFGRTQKTWKNQTLFCQRTFCFVAGREQQACHYCQCFCHQYSLGWVLPFVCIVFRTRLFSFSAILVAFHLIYVQTTGLGIKKHSSVRKTNTTVYHWQITFSTEDKFFSWTKHVKMPSLLTCKTMASSPACVSICHVLQQALPIAAGLAVDRTSVWEVSIVFPAFLPFLNGPASQTVEWAPFWNVQQERFLFF